MPNYTTCNRFLLIFSDFAYNAIRLFSNDSSQRIVGLRYRALYAILDYRVWLTIPLCGNILSKLYLINPRLNNVIRTIFFFVV